MFDRTALEALAAHEPQTPVVSLYLHLDPRLRATPEAYRAQLKGLLKEVQDQIAQDDLAAIERFFDHEFDWSGQGVALFSSQGSGLWQVEQFDVPLRPLIHIGRKPYITPLADALETYGAYTVALVDQQAIRMLHFNLGELVAQHAVQGEEVQRLKAGGGAGGAGRRGGDDTSGYVRQTVKGNLKKFADALTDFCNRQASRSLLLAGTDTTVAQFTPLMSQPCQDQIRGTFSMSMQSSDSEIQERSLALMQAARRSVQDKLVERIQALEAQGSAVLGLDRTLEAIYGGRVQSLALVEGYAVPGHVCANCGYAVQQPLDTCPYCAGAMRPVEDLAEQAVRKVIAQAGEIEIVGTDSALASMGRIGATLRY